MSRLYRITRIPRPASRCLWRGHDPVIAGAPGAPGTSPPTRWVTCSRCGMEPTGRGDLSPLVGNIGDPYTGRFDGPNTNDLRHATAEGYLVHTPPGPWPYRALPRSLSIRIAPSGRGVRAGFVLRPRRSERVAAWLELGRLGSIHVDTRVDADCGPDHWTDRLVSVSYVARRLSLDGSARRIAELDLDWRNHILGPVRVTVTELATASATARLPDGRTCALRLRLSRRDVRRTRGRTRREWRADWNCPQLHPYLEPPGSGRIHLPAEPHGDTWIDRATAAAEAALPGAVITPAAAHDHP
ncbi:hypothetical protein [Embleya scabrispora]|nr:hypothetical protein [Embleya scabrispora]